MYRPEVKRTQPIAQGGGGRISETETKGGSKRKRKCWLSEAEAQAHHTPRTEPLGSAAHLGSNTKKLFTELFRCVLDHTTHRGLNGKAGKRKRNGHVTEKEKKKKKEGKS